MIYLNKNQAIKIHSQIVHEFGGIHGIRDESMLESALLNPLQTFEGKNLYPTITEKAVQLCYGLIKNHPFIDGNKRTGLHLMLLILRINGLEISLAHKSLTNIIMNVADGTFTERDLLNKLKPYLNY